MNITLQIDNITDNENLSETVRFDGYVIFVLLIIIMGIRRIIENYYLNHTQNAKHPKEVK